MTGFRWWLVDVASWVLERDERDAVLGDSRNTANLHLRVSALLIIAASIAMAADQSGVRVVLQPGNERKAAPDLVLQDSSGKTMDLMKYRGKVVLLDFWATWCTGCKKEIPWFAEFQKTYGPRGFAVIGVSMDERGWKVLTPFWADNHVLYRIVLGNDSTAQKFGIQHLPDTFLIDQEGRVAAIYKGGGYL